MRVLHTPGHTPERTRPDGMAAILRFNQGRGA